MREMRRFDNTIFAQLNATQQRFETSWQNAETPADIPRLFRYKSLGKKQGKCTTAEIRAVGNKYRLTLCQAPSDGDSAPKICWVSVWRKHSNNDQIEVNAARAVCKDLCSREV